MPPAGQLALFSGAIVIGALGGAMLPLRAQAGRQLTFLAFAAGVMFGATFFHMLPEAYAGGGYKAFWWLPAGFLSLFLLERYVLVHACEEPPDCQEHAHTPAMGLTAFVGMSVHTAFDGIALGSAITEGVGLTAFIAILAHKIPSSLSLASLLKTEGRSHRSVLLFSAAFGLMVPIGALGYFLLDTLIPFERFSPLALAFSAGSFLYVAVSDLLPHVNRHGPNGRLRNILGMGVGLAVMLALAVVLGDHGHAHE